MLRTVSRVGSAVNKSYRKKSLLDDIVNDHGDQAEREDRGNSGNNYNGADNTEDSCKETPKCHHQLLINCIHI